LVKFGQSSATNSSGQRYFSPAPFELFGRNFGHLAILKKQKIGATLSNDISGMMETIVRVQMYILLRI
jgi:hypothetical protein